MVAGNYRRPQAASLDQHNPDAGAERFITALRVRLPGPEA